MARIPDNPLIDVADLPELCRFGREHRRPGAVDNTFATPLVQRPLAFGADLVLHSATKFIGGHSDLLLGIAVADGSELAQRLMTRRRLGGALPGALEAYLALRGLRTLAVRLARAQETAGILARRLSEHPAVTRVRYPGLPTDPGHALAARQMDGFGAMLAFEVAGGAAAADAVCAQPASWSAQPASAGWNPPWNAERNSPGRNMFRRVAPAERGDRARRGPVGRSRPGPDHD